MRNYSKVSPQFWIGKTGREIRKQSIEAQLVALYLLTCPQANMIGMFYLPIHQIGHETGLLEGASKGLRGCIDAGFCCYDEETQIVWVMEMANYQTGNYLLPTDNRAIAVQKLYNALPDNPYLATFYAKYGEAFSMTNCRGEIGEIQSPFEAPLETLQRPFEDPSKTLRSQKQKQEQKKEQNPVKKEIAESYTLPHGNSEKARAVLISKTFRTKNIKSSPVDPRIIALAKQEVAWELIEAACDEARRSKPVEAIRLGYVLAILERWARDAKTISVKGAKVPETGKWWASNASIEQKAKDLGLTARAGESAEDFKGRIRERIENGNLPKVVPPKVTEIASKNEVRSVKSAGFPNLATLVRIRENSEIEIQAKAN